MLETNREKIYTWINDVEMLTVALQRKDELLKSFERIADMTSDENDRDDLKEEANIAFRNLNDALKDACRTVKANLEGGKRKKRMTRKRKNSRGRNHI